MFLKICHYEKLMEELVKLRKINSHCPIGTLIREAKQIFLHPVLILVVQEVYKTYLRCQLMAKHIDIHFQNSVHPIESPTPFLRWGMNHTG